MVIVRLRDIFRVSMQFELQSNYLFRSIWSVNPARNRGLILPLVSAGLH